MSQQLAEKCLKALLIFHDQKTPKIHDLINLESILMNFSPQINNFHEDFVFLNRFYIETRYPGDFPEGFSWGDADKAFKAALKIKDFIFNELGI